MPQMHLPFFPDGVEHITWEFAFEKKDGQVTYFNGHMPVFIHAEEDIATFRMITAQFCLNGNAKQADIARAFGVTLISVKRAVKLYRQKGVAGFYEEPKRRGPAVLSAAVLKQAQELLDEGLESSEVAEQLGVKRDTLAKAIGAGRLHKPTKKRPRHAAKHQKPTQRRRRSGANGDGGEQHPGSGGSQRGGANGGRAGISSRFGCSQWGRAPRPASAVGGRSAASGPQTTSSCPRAIMDWRAFS